MYSKEKIYVTKEKETKDKMLTKEKLPKMRYLETKDKNHKRQSLRYL